MLASKQTIDLTISPSPKYRVLGKVVSYDPSASIIGIQVDNGGMGYSKNDPPTVKITGGGGNGATAIAFVTTTAPSRVSA